jgi:hypothetical protein
MTLQEFLSDEQCFKFLKWVEVIQQENLAVKNDSMYILEKNKTTCELIFIDTNGNKRKVSGGGLSFGYVPLAGTDPLMPITGDIEFTTEENKGLFSGDGRIELSDGNIKITSSDGAIIDVNPTQVLISQGVGDSRKYINLDNSLDYIPIQSDVNGGGIVGVNYYGDNYESNSFIQKQFSDENYANKQEINETLENKADLIGGKVPALQLPSYVDDILEFTTFDDFPITGEESKLYIALDTNKLYRWSGSVYVDITQLEADNLQSITARGNETNNDIITTGSINTGGLILKSPSTGSSIVLNVNSISNNISIDPPTESGKIALTSDIDDETLQTITERGGETDNNIISTADIQSATFSIINSADPLTKTIFKSDLSFNDQEIQIPDTGGAGGTMALTSDLPNIGIAGEVGRVGFFSSSNFIYSDPAFLWDIDNKRFAVGVTNPTASIDTNTLRLRALPSADSSYTTSIVAKLDGTLGIIPRPAVVKTPVPEDFYIAGYIENSANSSKIIYKTDIYRELNLRDYFDFDAIPGISNTNEILRIGNTFYLIINFGSSTANQNIIALRDCYLEDNILKVTKAETALTGIGAIHSFIYNETDGMLYAGSREYFAAIQTYPLRIVKIDPHTLAVLKTITFPYNVIFRNSTTDIKIFNNKLYITAGAGSDFKVYEVDTNLIDYTEIYSGTSDITVTHPANTPFEIYNGKMYMTCYDATVTGTEATNNLKIVEFNLITKAKRISSKILFSNTLVTDVNLITHWLTVYNDKLLFSIIGIGATYYYSSIARVDIKTLLKEEELVLDMPVTDDHSILNGYIYLNGESSTSYLLRPNYPHDNAKLLRINPNNFTDRTTEIAVFNGGKGSYGSINYTAKSKIQLEDLRNDPQQIITSASTYTLSPTKKLIHVYFNGTTTTFILPSIASYNGLTILLYNAGSGSATITANATDTNSIIDGNAGSNTFVLTTLTPTTIFSINNKWIIKP